MGEPFDRKKLVAIFELLTEQCELSADGRAIRHACRRSVSRDEPAHGLQ